MSYAVARSGIVGLVTVSAALSLPGCGGSDDGAAAGHGGVTRVELSRPDAAFPEALSSVAGVRELSDGRVMVADRLGQAVMIIDLVEGTADTIGRQGGGPGEYSSPARLFPWRGDSALLVDIGNTRFTPIGPDGGFGVSRPLLRGISGEAMSLVMPEGTDRDGHIYYQARVFSLDPGSLGAARPDSAVVVRWDPATDQVDTIASIGLPERRIERSGDNVSMATIPFSPSDDWGVLWDGKVAVVRAVGFHVEWWDPDGSSVAGPMIDDEPVPISQEDKDAWLEARANPPGGAMFIAIGAGDGGGDVRAGPPPRGSFVGPQVRESDWPAVKPPFPPGAVQVTPEGEVWVRRHTKLDTPPHYDVFDDRGVRVRTVVLPQDSEVVGFGNGAVYVARTDEYDLKLLERYGRGR